MRNKIENNILFDDAALLENRFGKGYLGIHAENISGDCNCSGYTHIDDEEPDTAKVA